MHGASTSRCKVRPDQFTQATLAQWGAVFFKVNSVKIAWAKGFSVHILKGVFSKPSEKHIVAPNLWFLSQRPQILATCLFLNFAELCKVSARLDNIDIRHFIRVPPLNFWQIKKIKKHQRGTLIKCIISMLSNLAETLHSSAKLKNKQVAKI